MKDECVMYQGRTVPMKGFRAFIYGANGITKLINSWEEFEQHMALGIWFSNEEAVIEASPIKEEEVETKKIEANIEENIVELKKTKKQKSKLTDENGVDYL